MSKSLSPADAKNSIQTYAKMNDVLECFSIIDRKLSLIEIADRAHLPRTTTHRILSALREIGFIEQDVHSGHYALGIRLFELGSVALANMDLRREAVPYIDQLSSLSGETVHLGVFNGHGMVIIEREGNSMYIRGEVTPAHCTSLGKTTLAFQDEDTIRRVIDAGLKAYTSTTLATPDALRKELERIRIQGYAVDNAEHQIGVRCVASPIRNARKRVFAAISITGSIERITEDRIPFLSDLVRRAADSISLHLGYKE